MSDSDRPRASDLERVEDELKAINDKLDTLILDPDEGVFARLAKLDTKVKILFVVIGSGAGLGTAAGTGLLQKLLSVFGG